MIRGYLRHPGSLLLRLLCVLSAVITGGVLLLVAGYVLCKGVPYLKPSMFAPKTFPCFRHCSIPFG